MEALTWMFLPLGMGALLVAVFLLIRLRTPPQREGPTASAPDYKQHPGDTGA